jgi:uncharacterized Zn finger protein
VAKRRSYYDDYWPQYESTRPREVKDGIKAKSARGDFVKNWWADQWIKALSSLMDQGRLTRGRSYARRGQVMEIDIKPGQIAARVQGSRPRPYKVSIWLKPLDAADWDSVLDALSEQAIFAAQLLAGEMPADIEQVFHGVKVSLFPARRGDLETDCSCPDWTNPCKHIAAVYYLLGERFDEDPFLLFELRGRSKEQIAAALRERRVDGLELREESPQYAGEGAEIAEAPALEECLERYWEMGAEMETLTLDLSRPEVNLALLKRLGMPGFLNIKGAWSQMEGAYEAVTARALEVAFSISAE